MNQRAVSLFHYFRAPGCIRWIRNGMFQISWHPAAGCSLDGQAAPSDSVLLDACKYSRSDVFLQKRERLFKDAVHAFYAGGGEAKRDQRWAWPASEGNECGKVEILGQNDSAGVCRKGDNILIGRFRRQCLSDPNHIMP